MSDAWRLAFGTLTTWKVPAPQTIDKRAAGRAMLIAPLTMLPLIAIVTVALWAFSTYPYVAGAPWLAAVALVTVHVLSTRGMHLDGIADVADGLSASYDRERALEIMKRSDVGPSGVGAIVLALITQTVSLGYLIQADALPAAAIALLASRHTLAWACHRSVPAATPTGLGATVAGSVSTPWLILSTTLLLCVAVGAAFVFGTPVAVMVFPLLVTILATIALLGRCRARLGGITGDVLGAGIEIGFSVALASAVLMLVR